MFLKTPYLGRVGFWILIEIDLKNIRKSEDPLFVWAMIHEESEAASVPM